MKIAIFKAESDTFEKYSKLLNENNIQIELIPSIEFKFKEQERLKSKLKTPEVYGGIVFTSPRCVQAVKLCNLDLNLWKTKQNFVVGETTYNDVNEELALEALGKETGNATKLAELIGEVYKEKNLPILYPCGNLKQDTLQKNLQTNEIQVDPVEVYETIPQSHLEENFLRVVNELECLIFFSPSGVNFTHEIAVKNNKLSVFNSKKLISIGPSTTKALGAKGLKVFATAESPTPEGLLKAILG